MCTIFRNEVNLNLLVELSPAAGVGDNDHFKNYKCKTAH